ncbi:MAG: ribonuclease P protein component [Bacteroidales bacterium]|nr:ribonuclease P protein component [Bacteroidales bacterium]
MEQLRYTFPKHEHLKSKSIIEKLYAQGCSVTAYPLRAVYLFLPPDEKSPTASILISVAKKRFRHATDRNLMKRRIREAYRLNKHTITTPLAGEGKKIAIAILYIDNKHSNTEFLKRKMHKLLSNILEKESKQCENSL